MESRALMVKSILGRKWPVFHWSPRKQIHLVYNLVEMQEEKGTREDETAGWHHWLGGREFEWTLEVGDGQGGLACCDSWGRRVGHDWATELNWTEETQVWSLGQEDPLEEGMATHPSILAWRIPWTEEPGGLESTGSERVGHNWSDLAAAAAACL